jgi:YXWGXW repeat-containing protein
MNVSRIASWCIVTTLFAISISIGFNNAAALQRGPLDGVEVLTRGPVHEAFAETVTFDPEPGLVAPKTPPAPIEELPPEQRPEGANVAWIPGYWAWDDERSDFLWVSGIWRALPPGRQWVPGYWARSGQGAQWSSGYWADAKISEVEYLPEPPATVETGPNVAAPSEEHTWLPGSWLWQQNRYAWRPGYWAAGQSDWNWVPAHYVWTPRGYVFVDGYYDYSVARRGVLFAPVYFNSGIYSQPGFSYSPAMVVSPAIFGSHLFLRPSYGHYYYGDYYGSNYATAGFSPWFSFNSSRYGYDPFYAQQRWVHRGDRAWDQNIQANFRDLRANENLRPPRTWADQNTRLASAGNSNRQGLVVATSLDELAKSNEHPLRFQPLNQTERQQLSQHGQAVTQLREQRQKLEGQAVDLSAAKSKSSNEFHPAKVTLPPSPIAAPPADRLGKDHTPPQRHEVLKPDLTVVPTARTAGGKAKLNQDEPKRTSGPSDVQLPKVAPREEPGREPKAALPGRSNANPQSLPQGKPQGQARGSQPGRSTVNPQPAPQGKPQGEAKGSSPGRANPNPQSLPPGKAQAERKGPPQRGAGEPPQGAPRGKPQGEAKNKSKN